jgi:hypothetical protein
MMAANAGLQQRQRLHDAAAAQRRQWCRLRAQDGSSGATVAVAATAQWQLCDGSRGSGSDCATAAVARRRRSGVMAAAAATAQRQLFDGSGGGGGYRATAAAA